MGSQRSMDVECNGTFLMSRATRTSGSQAKLSTVAKRAEGEV